MSGIKDIWNQEIWSEYAIIIQMSKNSQTNSTMSKNLVRPIQPDTAVPLDILNQFCDVVSHANSITWKGLITWQKWSDYSAFD